MAKPSPSVARVERGAISLDIEEVVHDLAGEEAVCDLCSATLEEWDGRDDQPPRAIPPYQSRERGLSRAVVIIAGLSPAQAIRSRRAWASAYDV
jgi:hypothetical protein